MNIGIVRTTVGTKRSMAKLNAMIAVSFMTPAIDAPARHVALPVQWNCFALTLTDRSPPSRPSLTRDEGDDRADNVRGEHDAPVPVALGDERLGAGPRRGEGDRVVNRNFLVLVIVHNESGSRQRNGQFGQVQLP